MHGGQRLPQIFSHAVPGNKAKHFSFADKATLINSNTT